MKRFVYTLVGFVGMTVAAIAAEPAVSDVVARQRYPWNGLVDVTCRVSGMDETTDAQKFAVAAVIPGLDEARKASCFWVMRDGAKSTDHEIKTNGNYHLLWDAKAELGEVFYSNMVVRVAVVDLHGKVQLWEDGPYWATTNIGAETPEEYGYYFWWGDTVGYKREGNAWLASDGSSSNFSFDSSHASTYSKSVDALRSEGWITADGVLAPAHDAARVQWGGDWRMPTKQEIDDLNSKCDWTWTEMNGVNGYVVRGRGDYISASIFLPCAGLGYGTSFRSAGSGGNYWSSVPYSGSNYSRGLYFNSGYYSTGNYCRYYGHSVRPVQGFTK